MFYYEEEMHTFSSLVFSLDGRLHYSTVIRMEEHGNKLCCGHKERMGRCIS
jgi:hypothetical protein